MHPYAVSEDLLSETERAKVCALNLQLNALRHCKKTEKQVAEIARELDLLEQLQNVRATARVLSLINARELLDRATANSDAAMHLFEEALLNLDEDEFDGFETAFKKARRLDVIERQSDQAGEIYHNALLRLGWEISEAQKHGIVG